MIKSRRILHLNSEKTRNNKVSEDLLPQGNKGAKFPDSMSNDVFLHCKFYTIHVKNRTSISMQMATFNWTDEMPIKRVHAKYVENKRAKKQKKQQQQQWKITKQKQQN